jgi:hypothetical protein
VSFIKKKLQISTPQKYFVTDDLKQHTFLKFVHILFTYVPNFKILDHQ